MELIKKDAACEVLVNQLFGTIKVFLSSSMLTQNIDYDILKMDNKTSFETIDKSFNIEYILNLYNLFKTAINKYKDFRRIVESKKQVYEKLVSTNKVNEVNDEDMIKNKEKLDILLQEKTELQDLYNLPEYIKIDIKNPKTLLILDIDYIKQIENLKKIIKSDDEYSFYKEKYDELKYLLKDVTAVTLNVLKKSYNPTIVLDVNKKIKPCELSFIKKEEDLLKQYMNHDENNDENHDDNNNDIKCLEDELKLLNEKYKDLNDKHKELINNKPTEITDPKITKEDHLKEINKIYETIDDLYNYISTNIKETRVKNKIDKCYNDYKKLLEREKDIENINKLNKEKIIKLENDFKLTFSKQQTLKIKNKPDTTISYKTSTTISKRIKNINIKNVEKNINDDDKILNNYYEKKDFISKLETDLLNYKKELELFISNDDYKYNPCCEICCKRSWVCRIKELEIIINTIESDIKNKKDEIDNDENNYLLIYERNENNNKMKKEYEILNEWLEYYKSKELYDKITKELNLIVSEKDETNKIIDDLDKELNEIKINKIYFNNISYDLYETFERIELYEKYKKWLEIYESINKEFIDVKTNITKIEYSINYLTNIKPRIESLHLLNKEYKEWEDYENKSKIINAHKLFELKDMLDDYEKYKEYTNNNNIKPLIRNKLKLYDEIKDIEKEIKLIENLIVKSSTINTYNKENRDSYEKLLDILTDLDETINTLEIIITNFQVFRMDMYEKYILNKLMNRVNKIIKSLCHKDTKPFKLDYLLTVAKENINLNWLINNEKINDIETNSKQLISITQASGFQHFVISLALRMSLFMNKQESLCNQLFIDEGFINFDKDNLSIVPSFIKGLLSYYNNIIIVSHIDLIQDNIDEIAEIKYNKMNSVSTMEYGNYKKVIKRRNKHQKD